MPMPFSIIMVKLHLPCLSKASTLFIRFRFNIIYIDFSVNNIHSLTLPLRDSIKRLIH